MSASTASRPLRRAAQWLAGRTLLARLLAGTLALLFVACAAVGLLTYAPLRAVLLSQLDGQLAAASQRYVSCEHPPGAPGPSGGSPRPSGSDCAKAPGQAAYTLSAEISHGAVLSAGTPAGQCSLTRLDEATLLALPAHKPVTRTLSALGGSYRLLAVPGPVAGTSYVSGLSMRSADTTLRDVAVAEVAVFSLALLLTGVLGAAWVRVSLRPLRKVAATATRVTELPLGSGEVSLPERVPDANPRTEVGQVGAAFNRMLGHVESALASRVASEARLRRFAADASHELRTPLAAIRGYAELARRHPGPVPGEVEHALGRVQSESARMSVLVDELLLLAQLDAGRPPAADPVDLTRLTIDVTSDARAASPDHRWRLELPDQPVVLAGDEQRLHQLLANLLSNAARHTPPGTEVVIAVAAPPVQPGGQDIKLTVADDGPGIPPDLLPAVFERFVRGDTSRSRAAGSSGLGLAIVQAVAAAHGGTAQVTSRPGETRFTIGFAAGRQAPDEPAGHPGADWIAAAIPRP